MDDSFTMEIPWLKGAHFIKGLSTVIQVRWELRFALTAILAKWSPQNFAHDATAVPSLHVQFRLRSGDQ